MSFDDLPRLMSELLELQASATPEHRRKIDRALAMLGTLAGQGDCRDVPEDPLYAWHPTERVA